MARRTASRWAQWDNTGRASAAPPTGAPGPLLGVPILQNQFANLRLVVEAAWGAILTQPSGTWPWTDITADVQVETSNNIVITTGRADEHATPAPASCRFTLDDRTNKYSQSPLGVNWPNVKRGTPIRVRLILNNATYTIFQGNAVGFTPEWDTTGRYAITHVEATGLFRRLGQGNPPLQSTMRLYTPAITGLQQYWPMEDQAGAPAFASGISGGVPMSYVLGSDVITTPNPSFTLHQDTTFVCSDALPVMNGSAFVNIPAYTGTGSCQVRMLINWPTSANALPDGTTVFSLYTTGSPPGRWDVVYHTGGSLSIAVFDQGGNSLGATGSFGLALDGQPLMVQLSLVFDSGAGNTIFTLYTMGPGGSSPTVNANTISSTSVGVARSLVLLPGNVNTHVAMGHVTVQSVATTMTEMVQPLAAFDGETAQARINRLLALAGVGNVTYVSDGVKTSVLTGPQRIDTLVNLLREAEQTEPGVLLDGLNSSMSFYSRTGEENQVANLTIDATSGKIAPPFEPLDDDLQLRNRWTVSQRNGSSVTFQDTGGTLGVNTIGLYADSVTINVNQNQNGLFTGPLGLIALADQASWRVHENTVEGYRYPSLNLAFHHSPDLLSPWLTAGHLSRVDVTNIASVYTQMPNTTVSLLVQGMTWTINQFLLSVSANCSPYEPWRVVQVAANSGDTSEFLCHLNTSGSSLVASVDAGATSLSVQTPSGPLWSTDADDVPFTVSVGGIPVTVTAVSGSSSPQTLTVTGVTKGLAAGSAVSVWQETALSL